MRRSLSFHQCHVAQSTMQPQWRWIRATAPWGKSWRCAPRSHCDLISAVVDLATGVCIPQADLRHTRSCYAAARLTCVGLGRDVRVGTAEGCRVRWMRHGRGGSCLARKLERWAQWVHTVRAKRRSLHSPRWHIHVKMRDIDVW